MATIKHPHIDHPLHHLSSLTYNFLQKCIEVIEEMPIAQGSIVMLVVGISLGTLLFGNVGLAAEIARIVAFSTVFILGLASLWLLKHDRRKERKILSASTIVLILSTLLQMFHTEQMVFLLIYNTSVTLFMIFVFLVALHGFRINHDYERGDKRNE